MRRITTFAVVGLLATLLVCNPAQAAKPSDNTNQVWTSLATSTADGSQWVMIQGERIQQPGNAIWYIRWNRGQEMCTYLNGSGYYSTYTYVGEKGTQTGATWGPTDYTFAYAGINPTLASLSLGEAYPLTLGTTWAKPLIDAGCTHGVLYSTAPGKDAKVLDDYVPLSLP
jgi:hypothetical protein